MSNKESDIVKAIQKGDIASFESLFKAYYPQLCSYAFRFVKTKEQSEEIVQELFFHLWKKKKEIKVHTSIKAYLYKATYLNSLAYLRQKKMHLTFAQDIYDLQLKFEESFLEQKELNTIIKRTMKALPEKEREIFRLSRYEGLKYREIADKLSISIKTVEAHMSKALKRFRTNLKDYVGMFLL